MSRCCPFKSGNSVTKTILWLDMDYLSCILALSICTVFYKTGLWSKYIELQNVKSYVNCISLEKVWLSDGIEKMVNGTVPCPGERCIVSNIWMLFIHAW